MTVYAVSAIVVFVFSSLPAMAGKLLGGMTFGLMVTAVVLVIALAAFGILGVNWLLLLLALLFSAAASSALGAFVSVAVREIFEAQTLANFIRFPVMFLGGVFVPVAPMPLGLQIVARLLPFTYSIEAFRYALDGIPFGDGLLDLAFLVGFACVMFGLAAWVMRNKQD